MQIKIRVLLSKIRSLKRSCMTFKNHCKYQDQEKGILST
jgi:hypothetical protein